MALVGNYGEYKNVYAKFIRIWGSNVENWNAWLGVFEKSYSQAPVASLLVTIPYAEGIDVYSALYAAAKVQYPFLCDEGCTPVEIVVESKEEYDAPVKKTRAKKNSA